MFFYFYFLFLWGLEEDGEVGGTELLFSALLTEAGVGAIVGLCVWVEERVMDWDWIEPRAKLLVNKTRGSSDRGWHRMPLSEQERVVCCAGGGSGAGVHISDEATGQKVAPPSS